MPQKVLESSSSTCWVVLLSLFPHSFSLTSEKMCFMSVVFMVLMSNCSGYSSTKSARAALLLLMNSSCRQNAHRCRHAAAAATAAGAAAVRS